MLDGIFNPGKKGRKGIYIAEIGLNHNGDMDTARRMIHQRRRREPTL
jgi:sialic acid synthase SpsE